MVILEIIIGFLGGVFGGLGMGGGTVLIPILSIFLNIEQKMAQGINLLSFLVMAIVSIIIHYKNGFIQTKGLFYIILGGAVFSVVGAFCAVSLSSNVLKFVFGVFLCILAISEFVKVFKKAKK